MTITQPARDAAADFLESRMGHSCSAGLDCLFSGQIRRGEADWHVLVQAFQRAIDAAEARQREADAKVAEGYKWSGTNMKRGIAAAIREGTEQ